MKKQPDNRASLICSVVIFLLLAGASASHAQVTVSNVIQHFKFNTRPVKNVSVGNSSSEPLYVEVTITEVLNPESGGTKTAETDALLASPKAFSVEANGERTVRLLLRTAPTDKERVFRVTFAPSDRSFGHQISKTSGNRTTIIKVLSGMGMLVFADPIAPHAELAWERTNSEIRFSNSGNEYMGNPRTL